MNSRSVQGAPSISSDSPPTAEGDPLVLTHPSGEKTLALRNLLLDIQSGRAADPYGWRVRVC